MKGLTRSVVGVGLVLMLASTAAAAPSVSITSPSDGTTVSRSATPMLALAGAVTFDTPQPSQQQYYLRRTSCNEDKRLSVVQGSETGGCGLVVSVTPANEVTRTPDLWPTVDGIPFTLDASRPLTGVITLSSYIPPTNVGAGLTSIDISVTGTTASSGVSLGSTTVSYTALPGQQYSTPWAITLPSALNKQDLTELTLSTTVRGVNALHGFTTPNASHMTIPTYSASFNRRVEVAVDSGAYTSTGVSLSPDLASWSGSIATPAVGGHFIRARAVQGSTVSSVASNVINVTA